MTSPNENYTSWHCGMKVVCVDNAGLEPSDGLSVGGVYTVTMIGTLGGRAGVTVQEANQGCPAWPAFYAYRFRPVQTRRTDISVFQRILSNPHKKIHKVEGERV